MRRTGVRNGEYPLAIGYFNPIRYRTWWLLWAIHTNLNMEAYGRLKSREIAAKRQKLAQPSLQSFFARQVKCATENAADDEVTKVAVARAAIDEEEAKLNAKSSSLKRSLQATQDIFTKAFCQARDSSGKIKPGRPADPIKVWFLFAIACRSIKTNMYSVYMFNIDS